MFLNSKVQYLPSILAILENCYPVFLLSIFSWDKNIYSESALSLYFRNT